MCVYVWCVFMWDVVRVCGVCCEGVCGCVCDSIGVYIYVGCVCDCVGGECMCMHGLCV